MTKYNSVQCVGFTLGTGLNFNEYTGLKRDEEDWKARVQVMNEAIERAFASRKINRRNDCLKIFMAPEFFFRGLKGAYDMDTCSQVVNHLKTMVNRPKYKDWLFVFGTIVGYSNTLKDNIPMFEAYNFSLIEKGFRSGKDSYIVMKELKSAIDFVDPYYRERDADQNILHRLNTRHLEKIPQMELRNEVKVVPYDSNAVFDLDGIRFGVEICLDNISRRINRGNLFPEKEVEILLAPSCGNKRIRFNQKVSEQCIGFICDGAHEGFSEVKLPNQTSIHMAEKIEVYPWTESSGSNLATRLNPFERIFNGLRRPNEAFELSRNSDSILFSELLGKLFATPNPKLSIYEPHPLGKFLDTQQDIQSYQGNKISMSEESQDELQLKDLIKRLKDEVKNHKIMHSPMEKILRKRKFEAKIGDNNQNKNISNKKSKIVPSNENKTVTYGLN